MRFWFAFLFALVILIEPPPAHSNERPNNQYNMGIIGLAPYAMAQDDGTTTGYMVDITMEIRKVTGLDGHDEVLPLKRLHGYLASGEVDCTILARVTLTENIYDMIEPIGKNIKSAIVARAGTRLSSYDDLKGLVIAVPYGVTLDKRFHEDTTLEKYPTNGYLQSTMMLQAGRIDAMIGVWDSYLYNMRNIGMGRNEIGDPLILNEVPIWFMCRPDFANEAVKTKLKETVRRLREQGVIRKIIAKYLGDFS